MIKLIRPDTHQYFDDPISTFYFFLNAVNLDHRITEWPGLQRSTVLIEFQPPAMCRVANQQPRLPRATSSLALDA